MVGASILILSGAKVSVFCAAGLYEVFPDGRHHVFIDCHFARGSRIVGMLERELEQWCLKGSSDLSLVQVGLRV